PDHRRDVLALERRDRRDPDHDRQRDHDRERRGGVLPRHGRRPEDDRAPEQPGDHDRVDRAPALLGPVHVLEVEPERANSSRVRPAPIPNPTAKISIHGSPGWRANSRNPQSIKRMTPNTRWWTWRSPLVTLPGHHGTFGLRIRRALVRMKRNARRNETMTRTPASRAPPLGRWILMSSSAASAIIDRSASRADPNRAPWPW